MYNNNESFFAKIKRLTTRKPHKTEPINIINKKITDILIKLECTEYNNSSKKYGLKHKIRKKMSKKYYTSLKKLLNKGGNINILYKGDNLLYHAINYYINESFVKFLIKNGCSIRMDNISSMTILLTLIKNNKIHLLKYLVNNGLNIHAIDRNKDNIITNILKYYNKSSKYFVNYIVDYFVEHKVSVNQINNNHDTPLTLAIKTNNIQIIKYLIIHGANIHYITPNNDNVLLKSMKCTNIKLNIINFFINNGIDINQYNNNRKSVMSIIVEQNDKKL